MDKCRRIDIRITEDEYIKLDKYVRENNITKSEYIRSKINSEENNYNLKSIVKHIYNIQYYITRLSELYDTNNVYTNALQKEIDEIWQCL